jgi:hypothetical protein
VKSRGDRRKLKKIIIMKEEKKKKEIKKLEFCCRENPGIL